MNETGREIWEGEDVTGLPRIRTKYSGGRHNIDLLRLGSFLEVRVEFLQKASIRTFVLPLTINEARGLSRALYRMTEVVENRSPDRQFPKSQLIEARSTRPDGST